MSDCEPSQSAAAACGGETGPAGTRPRIAVLLPAGRSCAWQEQTAAALAARGAARVELCRVAVRGTQDRQWQRIARATAPLEPCAVVDAAPAPLPGAAEAAAAKTSAAADAASGAAGATVAGAGEAPLWDAVIDLAGVEDPARWRASARHGVWRPLDGQGAHLAGAWPCLAAIGSGQGGELHLVRDGERVLDTVRFSAGPLYAQSFARAYAAVLPLLLGVLQELAAHGRGFSAAVPGRAFAAQAPLTPLRRAGAALRARSRAWRQRLRAQWLSESWMIGVIDAPIQAALSGQGAPGPVRWLGPRGRHGYRADPFGLPGQARVYCEFYDYRDGLGRLQALDLDPRGTVVQARTLPVSAGRHASYPFVFQHQGQCYAVPETAAQRRCVLHRIEPDGAWTPLATLLEDVAAADATLFEHGGLFWLAYTDLALGAFDNLCLRYAEDLRGPWRPHALHPVKLDLRSARPAGTPFLHQGALYRPAQDCADGYGSALAINRIEVCTPQRYRESVVRRCLPDPRGANPHGLHTLSAWGERTLVDGKRYVFNPHELARKLRARVQGRAPGPAR